MLQPKLLSLLLLLSLSFSKTSAQFGTTPQVITSSNLPLAVGDVKKMSACDTDGNGRSDLLVTSATGAIVFRSDGSSSLHAPELMIAEDLSTAPTGFFGASWVDLDADGLPDLAVGKSWRKNLGNGVYSPQQPAFARLAAQFVDLDSDGLPDMISLDSNTVYWQKNMGSGLFASEQALLTANNPLLFATADLNADGYADLIARQIDGCFWYKNLGNGSLESQQLLTDVPDNLETTDLDNDGLLELMYSAGGKIAWQEIDTNGVAMLLQTIATTFNTSRGFTLGDLNADGYADLLIGGLTNIPNGHYYPFLPGTGLFSTARVTPTSGQFPHYGPLCIMDIDADGNNDFCTAFANNYKMVWFRQISPGAFSFFTYAQAGLNIPFSITSVDYDSDGDLDLVASGPEPTNSAASSATVVVNLGNGQFDEKRGYPGGGTQQFSGDLDGDGLKDRAFYGNNDSIYWQKFLGNNLWGARKSLPGLITSCKRVAGADLDNDGDIDLFACNGTDAIAVNARFYWFENDGTGQFTPHLLETGIQFCSNAFPLDYNEDGWLDMVLYFFNNQPRVYLNLGGGIFSPPANFFQPGTPSPSNVNQSLLTDLDADGRIDYVYITKNWGDQKIAWYRNLGPSGFSGVQTIASWTTNAGWATNYFTVFDATGDGLPDIVISDNYWAKIRFIKGLGNGTFSPMSVVYSETQPFNYGNFFAIAPYDVNGDGKLDIVYGKRSLMQQLPNYLMWLGNESPTLPPAVQILNQQVYCHNNNTPADPSDDVRVLKMNASNPANPAGLYVLSESSGMNVLDTLVYQTPAFYRWPTGSADDGFTYSLKISDLENPALFQQIQALPTGTCSFDAPTTIALSDVIYDCMNNGTPHFAGDDFVAFTFMAKLQNTPQASPGFTISSDAGALTVAGTNLNNLQYGIPYIFELPAGSAAGAPVINLTIQDKQNPAVQQPYSFNNPGICSTTATWEAQTEEPGFTVFPNPVSGITDLHIQLGASFNGAIKLDLLSLDGRALHTQYVTKTAPEQTIILSSAAISRLGDVFLVRVTDGESVGVEKVVRVR